MKKILFVFGILSFGIVNGQQPLPADIEKLLKEKGKHHFFLKDGSQYKILLPDSAAINKPKPSALSHILPNGDKVYLLSQDNMPCIVPGTTQPLIPNLSLQVLPYYQNKDWRMPNVVVPHSIIVK